LAGVVLADAHPGAPVLAALFVSLSLYYTAGMYLNDAFDRDLDARERPERPIPSGVVAAGGVFAAGYGMMAVATVILGAVSLGGDGVLGPFALGSGALLGGAILLYNVWHKQNPASGALMGICRMLVYVTAALATAGRLTSAVMGGALVLFSYLIGVTHVAKQEHLARLRNLWPCVFLAAPFLYAAPALIGDARAILVGANNPSGSGGEVSVIGSAVHVLVYAGLLFWVVICISLLTGRRAMIPRAVSGLIAGISLLDALLIAGHGRPGVAAVAAIGFAVTLIAQRFVPGT
jgi:4-hydroxybenzoate polyprenyltransferase